MNANFWSKGCTPKIASLEDLLLKFLVIYNLLKKSTYKYKNLLLRAGFHTVCYDADNDYATTTKKYNNKDGHNKDDRDEDEHHKKEHIQENQTKLINF